MIKLRSYKKRAITLSRDLANYEPIIKSLNLLKVTDMFKLCQIKFYYIYIYTIITHRIIPKIKFCQKMLKIQH